MDRQRSGREKSRVLAGPAVPGVRHTRAACLYAALGVAPDFDLLLGSHNTYSHSIGAAALAGVLVAIAGRGREMRLALAAAMAYGSHVVLDWLGHDAVPPIGIMALWPFDDGFHLSSLHLFLPVRREYWEPGFVSHTLRALGWELVVLGPLAAVAWWRATRAER